MTSVWFVDKNKTSGDADGRDPDNAFLTITAALNAASQNDTILVLNSASAADTYDETVSIGSSHGGVSLIGPGNGRVTISPSTGKAVDISGSVHGFKLKGFDLTAADTVVFDIAGTNGPEGLIVEDIAIDTTTSWTGGAFQMGSGTTTPTERCRIKNLFITSANGSGFQTEACFNCHFENIQCVDCGGDGFITGTSNGQNVFVNCVATGNGDSGFDINPGFNYNLFINCTAMNNTSSDIDDLGTGNRWIGTATDGAGNLAADVIAVGSIATDALNADALATDAAEEIRDTVTGGAYALDTDANGRVRIVDGTGAGELDTDSGTVLLRAATEAQIDAIETDTNEMQGKLPTNNIMGSSVKTDKDDEIDAILVDTGTTIPAQISALNNISTAQVNAEVDTALADFWTSPATLVDLVWDEPLTGATHNVANSSGRRLRNLQDLGIYDQGAVWIDTTNGTAGTTAFENGTVTNPVDTIADALTIATATGLRRFHVAPGSTITLAAAADNYLFFGENWTLALGGQSVSGTTFIGATVSGNDDGSNTSHTNYKDCEMGTCTLGQHHLENCRIDGDITLAEATTFNWSECFSNQSSIADKPIINFGAAVGNCVMNVRGYFGGLEVQNMGQTGTDALDIEGMGNITLNANCVGGTADISGLFTLTDNSATTTVTDDGRFYTRSEEPSAVPAVTAGVADKMNWLAQFFIAKSTQTSSTFTLRNGADDSDLATATISDDGTTVTRGAMS